MKLFLILSVIIGLSLLTIAMGQNSRTTSKLRYARDIKIKSVSLITNKSGNFIEIIKSEQKNIFKSFVFGDENNPDNGTKVKISEPSIFIASSLIVSSEFNELHDQFLLIQKNKKSAQLFGFSSGDVFYFDEVAFPNCKFFRDSNGKWIKEVLKR